MLDTLADVKRANNKSMLRKRDQNETFNINAFADFTIVLQFDDNGRSYF